MIRNDLQSRTIDALRMVLIFCVVLVHAYTSTRADIDTGEYPVYRFVSFLLSLNIAQVAIPGFFFISGYLYFHTPRTFPQRVRHDWFRLVVPYLFWNALILGMYWCVECIPAFRGYFSGDNLPVHQYTFVDFLRAFWDSGRCDDGNGTPILHQFWYIRNLLVLGLLSPLIRRWVQWTGVAGLVLLTAWWVFAPGPGMIAKSFAFFTFGAWFSIRSHDFLPSFQRHFHTVTFLYIALVVLTMCFWSHPWSVWINRLNNTTGIVFLTALTAKALASRESVRPLSYLQGLTFFIYAAHDPLIIFVKRMMLRITAPPTDLSLTVIYFLSAIVVVALSTGVYFLVKKWCPKLLSLMVGARTPEKAQAR